jgi:hypothetical protein
MLKTVSLITSLVWFYRIGPQIKEEFFLTFKEVFEQKQLFYSQS